MKFNALFPGVPLTLIRSESGLYVCQHSLTDRITIKSPVADPINTEFCVLIGEETGTYRNSVKYIRRVKILLFPPDSDLPRFNLEISRAKGVLRFDQCEIAYAIALQNNEYLKISVY
jgi:hypothetical protein